MRSGGRTPSSHGPPSRSKPTPGSAHSNNVKQAFSVTKAYFVTEDFVALSDASELQRSGIILEDRAEGSHIQIHSLLELERGRCYMLPRGNTLAKRANGEVWLNDEIRIPMDDCDEPSSPSSSIHSPARKEPPSPLRAAPICTPRPVERTPRPVGRPLQWSPNEYPNGSPNSAGGGDGGVSGGGAA